MEINILLLVNLIKLKPQKYLHLQNTISCDYETNDIYRLDKIFTTLKGIKRYYLYKTIILKY
jgi:hypothetical protein